MRANQHLDQRAWGFSHGEIAAEAVRPSWAGGGYDGAASATDLGPRSGSAGEVFTGATTDELGQEIRVRWQAMR